MKSCNPDNFQSQNSNTSCLQSSISSLKCDKSTVSSIPLFIPDFYMDLISLLQLQSHLCADIHKVKGLKVYRPMYHCRPVLVPGTIDDEVNGRLLPADLNCVALLDCVLDEGRTVSRIVGHSADDDRLQLYVWNGNSLVGEWQLASVTSYNSVLNQL